MKTPALLTRAMAICLVGGAIVGGTSSSVRLMAQLLLPVSSPSLQGRVTLSVIAVLMWVVILIFCLLVLAWSVPIHGMSSSGRHPVSTKMLWRFAFVAWGGAILLDMVGLLALSDWERGVLVSLAGISVLTLRLGSRRTADRHAP